MFRENLPGAPPFSGKYVLVGIWQQVASPEFWLVRLSEQMFQLGLEARGLLTIDTACRTSCFWAPPPTPAPHPTHPTLWSLRALRLVVSCLHSVIGKYSGVFIKKQEERPHPQRRTSKGLEVSGR